MKYFILALVFFTVTACEKTAEPQWKEPDPIALWIVNTQPYFYGDMGPVTVAYEHVATHLDWDIQMMADGRTKLEAWREFVITDLIAKESGGCPNIRGGTRYNAIGDSCNNPVTRGRKTDSGFGQVTPVLYHGSNSTICKNTGICSSRQVIESPWNSMMATLITIEKHGSQPWCYNKFARSYHNCSLAPDR